MIDSQEPTDPFIAKTPWVVSFLLVVAIGLVIVSINSREWVPLLMCAGLVIMSLIFFGRWRRWKQQ